MDNKLRNYRIEIIDEIIDSDNGNIDVSVKFNNGEKYIATFFTLKNIEALMNKGDELLSAEGKFFWASDMIIVKELTVDNIYLAIDTLLDDFAFVKAFQKIT